MENYFNDVDFEPGMVLVVNTVKNCIDNDVIGFIKNKSKEFTVSFVFYGLKNLKRKAEVGLWGLAKMRKLNVSMENLLLNNSDLAVSTKDGVASVPEESSELDLDGDLNIAGGSRGRKRVAFNLKSSTLAEKNKSKKSRK